MRTISKETSNHPPLHPLPSREGDVFLMFSPLGGEDRGEGYFLASILVSDCSDDSY